MLERKTDLDSDECISKCKGRNNKCPNYTPYTEYFLSIIPIGDRCALYSRFARQREAYLDSLKREKS